MDPVQRIVPDQGNPEGTLSGTLDSSPFSGVIRLYGQRAFRNFEAASVAIIGLGGVGSWVGEALARSGIGRLLLVDGDDICISNTNRQIHALDTTWGRNKAEVLAARLQSIHPRLQLDRIDRFLTLRNLDMLWSWGPHVVVDAIDAFAMKQSILLGCLERNIPLILSGAAGGRRDPAKVRVADLTRTTHDALLRRLRKNLRREGYLPPNDEPLGIQAIYAEEAPVYAGEDSEPCSRRPARLSPIALDCQNGFGTSCPVTATFGMVCAAQVLEKLRANPAQPIKVLS